MKFERQAGSDHSGPVVPGKESGMSHGDSGKPLHSVQQASERCQGFPSALCWPPGEQTARRKEGGKAGHAGMFLQS